MERNFTNENMEEFLRQSAESLRMRPSARVWKGISSHLGRRRRVTGFILGTSILVTTALGFYLFNEPASNSNKPVSKTNIAVEKAVPRAQETPYISQSTVSKTSISRKNISYRKQVAETPEFTFTQTLLQRNNEVAQNAFTPTIVDSYSDQVLGNEIKSSLENQPVVDNPLTIESIVNSYQPKAKKLSWQTYFTPTISYRKLNNSQIDNVSPHKPAFGFELGMAARYAVSKNAKLRAGLQFNVNRYDIKTFESYYTQTATIRLNDRNGVNYVRTPTNYNNYTGNPNWLQNFYFQVSAPVGIEFKVKGDDKVQFGVASTLQPTYLLGDKAYVISTDYVNYAKMPALVRHWNINTSLETFVSYSTGHLNWQVGPQFRYQLLSSYLQKYPVKENLFDFGLKVGISVNK